MATYYLDTSAIVKGYSPETGSKWVESLIDPMEGHIILLSEISLVEMAAALAAKSRAPGGPSIAERDRVLSRFLQDCDEQYQLLGVGRDVIDLAVQLTQRQRLRGCDAVQLASAFILNQALLAQGLPPLVFVCADEGLLTAAQNEGFSTENPNWHP